MRLLGLKSRHKRCPKCKTLLRKTADVCPQCGVKMPGIFGAPPVPADVERRMRELKERRENPPPSPAPLARRYLIIVARDRQELYTYLTKKFAGDSGVDVIVERRVRERRRESGDPPLNRRRSDRRMRPDLTDEFRTFGFAIVVRR